MRLLPCLLLVAFGCRVDDAPTEKSPTAEGEVDVDGDGFTVEAGDCDDHDNQSWPGALELCNGRDDDCDDAVDEDVTTPYYADADGDGFGDPASVAEQCAPSEGYVDRGTDCDDDDATVFPGAEELCDGVDNDCDGTVDDGVSETWYADADEDGHGDAASAMFVCEKPEGAVASSDDCDDGDAEAFPGGDEVCDSADNDCDGFVDEGVMTVFYVDLDGDGFGDGAGAQEACFQPTGYADDADDCDDAEAAVNPDATESCNEIDDDCDGGIDETDAVDAADWYADTDGDTYGDPSVGVTACTSPAGYVADNADCDDSTAAVNPAATEVCNGADDDCDGTIDGATATDLATWYLDYDGDGYGGTRFSATGCDAPAGYVADASDCDDTEPTVSPGAAETCNGVDDDCDGTADDGISSVTAYADTDGDGYGDPTVTATDCALPSGYVADASDCDDGDASINPAAAEACNGLDDDCDGDIDEGMLGRSAACPAEDCTDVLDSNPSAGSGSYSLDAGSYYCDMATDGGGWTRVKEDLAVYGTGYDTTYYNGEGFTWTEVLFAYGSGTASAHCVYPDSLTGCNNLGFQFAGESWGVPLNWGSSICGMATTDYTTATSYIGGYDFVIARATSADTIRLGALEGISSCTTGDNPGTAYVDVLVRR